MADKLFNNMSETISELDEFSHGRWTQEEHEKFLQGLLLYKRNWKSISNYIITRSSKQVRSHAQKYFQKKKRYKNKAQYQQKHEVNDKEYLNKLQTQLEYQKQINHLNQWYLDELKKLLQYNTGLMFNVQQGKQQKEGLNEEIKVYEGITSLGEGN